MLDLITNPTKKHLSEIKEWMEEESKSPTNEGLYVNWPIIERGFKNKELLVLNLNKRVIGFNLFSQFKALVAFDIFEINPKYRKKGFGQQIILQSINYFQTMGFNKFIASCINENSKRLLLKIGFIKVDYLIEYPNYDFCFKSKEATYKDE